LIFIFSRLLIQLLLNSNQQNNHQF